MIALIFLVLCSTSQQVPFTNEVFSDPVCNNKGKCFECSFSELRQISNCYNTGYVQTIYCTMTSSLNNTQEISYISPCSPRHTKTISNFAVGWIGTILMFFLMLFNWKQIKLSKSQDLQNITSNIIKT